MTLPATGQLTLAQIQAEFGGVNPISLNEYYKGGAYVPNISENNGVPTSGTISLGDFHGATSTGGGGGGPTATVSPSSLYTTGTGSQTSAVATATGAGGTVTGYSWVRVSGDATITINSPTAHTTSFTANVPTGITKAATFRCTITFSGGGTASDTTDVTFDSGV